MKFYKNDDPSIDHLKPRISHRISRLEEDETPYYLLVEEDNPLGMIVIREEPMYFYAISGSRFGEVFAFQLSENNFEKLVAESPKILVQENLTYLIYSKDSFNEHEIEILRRNGYSAIDHAYAMYIEVESSFKTPEGIQLRPMNIEERSEFLSYESALYKDSGDKITSLVMENIRAMKEGELDTIYNEDTSYYVYVNGERIGIIVIFIDRGGIASIAIDPKYRGKRYGEKVIRFALNKLRELGWNKIYLRVHAENESALRLYKRMGFQKAMEMQTYARFT